MQRALLSAALVLALAATASAETDWTGYTYLASNTSIGSQAMQDLADEFAAATGGEVKIQLNLAGALPIKAADITQSVGDGVFDIAADGFFLGTIEEGGVLRLPMLFTSMERFQAGVAAVTPFLEQSFAEKNVVLLAQYLYPLQVSWGTGQITRLDDLAGKKLRVSSPEQGAFVTAFGGSPVTIGGAEVPTALQTGVVEGVFTASVGGGRLWKDQLHSTYRLGPNYFNSVIIVNKDAFDALSPEHQAVLRELAQKHAARATQRQIEDETATTAELAAGGISVYEPTEADVQRAVDAMRPYWQEWAAGKSASTQAALAAALDAIGD
jgi:TRAP-type C4-dicarboxylate transport system substrate-binding protein